MGGYFNMFLETSVTKALVLELRGIVESELPAEVVDGRQHGKKFGTWFASAAGQRNNTYARLHAVVVRALQGFCAKLYAA
eukprot:1759695-Prymnesium_polylepis.1